MIIVLGCLLGAGLVFVASPLLWPRGGTGRPPRRRTGSAGRMRSRLTQAGLGAVPLPVFLACCGITGLIAAALAQAIIGVAALTIALGATGLVVPWLAVGWRATARAKANRAVWPDAVDQLVSAVRSGLALPDGVSALAILGPEATRPAFAAFERDYRATGAFAPCIDRLKHSLADPVADRILETLKMAREVGGTELTAVLKALASGLREDAAIRAEVEARQSWVVNAARLGVAAPWIVLVLLSTRPEAALAYNTPTGTAVIACGLVVSVIAYRVMVALGRLPPGTQVVRVTATASWAILCGVGLGLGLWSLIAMVPRLSRPRLADRVAPYVIDVSDEARELVERTRERRLPIISAVLGPFADAARSAAERVAGGNESVALRLRQSGSVDTVERFRSRQLTVSAVALAAGVALIVTVSTQRPVPLLAQIAVPVVFTVCAFAIQDWQLTRRARARLKRIADEFPTVVELLTLSLSAGEGILDALRRVSVAGTGELAYEFGRVVADVRIGIPLADALADVSRGIRLAMLTRCIDAVSSALERGTPLAEVLRAQAADAREEAKRQLLETAGKKEVAMLVPLVFLILPVTVLFAIYPGLFVLQSGF